MIIPPIKSRGLFTFKPPFDKKLHREQEYTVIGIRMLLELSSRGERPYETIYKPVNITEAEFKSDLEQDVPIVVFTNTGGETFLVPANRITSQPMVNGIRYQEKVLVLSLGNLPINYDLSTVISVVTDCVYDTIGIKSNCKVLPGSSIVMYSEDEHKIFSKLLEGAKKVDKSYKTRYLETSEKLAKQTEMLSALEKAVLEKKI